jgi:transglutaminase-like putative cysteine protease
VIDHHAVDWARVARATFHVRVHYRYTYTAPVTNLRQRLIAIPPDRHGNQLMLSHSLVWRGGRGVQTVQWERDEFGNRICRLTVEGIQDAIDFEANYRLETGLSTRSKVPPSPRADGQWTLFLRHTALTAPDDRLRCVAHEIARECASAEARVMRAHEWAASAITYQFGVTDVQTPAAMALYLGKGVCQDYAHILIAVLRLMGIAARYVSGYLPGDGPPHAWVEALLDDPAAPGGTRVLALDPSHRRVAGLGYLTVAVGRDYSDVSPTSGFFSGAAAGRLSSSKQASILELTSSSEDESVA